MSRHESPESPRLTREEIADGLATVGSLKRTVGLLSFFVVLLLITNAILVVSVFATKARDDSRSSDFDVVKAHQFILLDANSNVKGKLEVSDKDAKPNLALFGAESGALSLGFVPNVGGDFASLAMTDNKGNLRLSLRAGPKFSELNFNGEKLASVLRLKHFYDIGSSLFIGSSSQGTRVEAGAVGTDNAFLFISDKDNNRQEEWKIGTGDEIPANK